MLSRRDLIRCGVGSFALPFLESVLAKEPDGVPQPAGAPKRLVAVAIGMGVYPPGWWAKGDGEAMQFGPALEPFAKLRREMLVIEGLFHPAASNYEILGNAHWGKEVSVFCGVRADPQAVRLATTFDQVVARQIGPSTPVPSLVLNGEGIGDNLWKCRVSWLNPQTPAPIISDPRRAFARVFDTAPPPDDERSILDAVHGDLARLGATVSRADGQRLQEWQDSIRELEVRIQAAHQPPQPGNWQPAVIPAAELQSPGTATDLVARWDLLFDVILLALRADRTRVVSFLMSDCNGGANFSAHVPGSLTYHGDSHNVKPENLTEISRLHMKSLARFAERMHAIDEGGGSLLDHSAVLYTSGQGDATKHNSDYLHSLLLGRAHGAIRPGRTLDFSKDPHREMNRLFLSLIQASGVSASSYEGIDRPLDLA
ncbi:hypothetical protein LBMAG53_17100 [Planctomycetota bacterium]|nr:hypothetical protein LBMAG53_17100 [Planctomycetota bacterium]